MQPHPGHNHDIGRVTGWNEGDKLYEAPALIDAEQAPMMEQNPWIGPLLAFVLVVYGSAWAFCMASCGGWRHVHSCGTGWFPPSSFRDLQIVGQA